MQNLLDVLFEIEFHKANNDKSSARKHRAALIKETRKLINELDNAKIGSLSGVDLINNATDLINWMS